MQSEVRKVLDSYSFFEIPRWLTRLDAAERADAAKRDEPVQELRQAVAELVARWSVHYVPIDAAMMVRRLLAELNAIIAAKSGVVEDRQATASGPVHDVAPVTVQQVREIVAEKISEMVDSLTFIQEWKEEQNDQWREIKPVIEPAVAEKVYEIATRAVRDAMPDLLDAVAKTFRENGLVATEIAFCEHAEKLRKERGK